MCTDQLKGGVAAGTLSAIAPAGTRAAEAAESPYADPAEPALPQTDMEVSLSDTALVIIDPQFFLSSDGVTWSVVGESVTENGTVENISILLETAKAANMTTFLVISSCTAKMSIRSRS